MVKPDNAMHELQALRRTNGPSPGQHRVVDVFQPKTGDLAKNIQRIEYFLKVHQADLPGTGLFRDNRAKSRGGRTVASAGVEVHEIDSRYPTGGINKISHYCFIPTSLHCYARGLKR